MGSIDGSGGSSPASGGAPSVGGDGGGSGAPECPEREPLGTDEEDGGTHDGNLAITAPGHEVLLGTYSTIRGDLLIGPVTRNGPLIEEIDLSHVRVVEGSLRILNTGLSEIVMPRLETVGGELWISKNFEAVLVSLPELRSSGPFFLDANLELPTSEFPKLETVTGQLFVHRNLKLVSWGFDALHTVDDDVSITANPLLPHCLVDALALATERELSSELNGNEPIPDCDCSNTCGRLVPTCR